jgi:toxin FitB
MYLIGTNVVYELRRQRRTAPLARGSIRFLMPTCTSAVTIGEIQAGIELKRDQDPARAAALTTWLEHVIATPQILPMDERPFRRWAEMMRRRPQALSDDAMIAATAAIHRLTVVTRNVRDFQPFDVPILNAFQHPRA